MDPRLDLFLCGPSQHTAVFRAGVHLNSRVFRKLRNCGYRSFISLFQAVFISASLDVQQLAKKNSRCVIQGDCWNDRRTVSALAAVWQGAWNPFQTEPQRRR